MNIRVSNHAAMRARQRFGKSSKWVRELVKSVKHRLPTGGLHVFPVDGVTLVLDVRPGEIEVITVRLSNRGDVSPFIPYVP